MENLHPGFLVGLLVFLLLCSAFFSSSETGMLSLNRYRLRHQAKEGHRGARRASELLAHPDRLLGTILVGNNFVNILASSIATVLAMQLWGEAGIAIATIGLTIILLIFGEITPKTLAALRPEIIAYPVSLPLKMLQKVLYPLVAMLSWVSNGLLGLLGVDLSNKGNDSLSTEELRSVVRESGSDLPLNRQSMLLGILDLERVTVDDIMIPRNEVAGIDLDDDLEAIISQLRTTPHTRLPVFRNDINQIEGIVHMRQIARLLSHDQLTKESLLAACTEPYFVPENTPLSTQLLNFQKQKRRIGIVVDEYGDVRGVVTLEDILEEIVGEFSNQDTLRSPDIHPQEDGTLVIDGAAYIREVNRALDWHLPCDGPKTLNGLITEALEHIPDSGICLQIGNYRLEILQAADNRVKSVRAWTVSATPSTEQQVG
ncbi:magnesium and cobalt efflux protein CorC [Streptococcus pneumoniae]|uniref:Mg2+ and Co2+ transporter CorB n=3 Tax=Stutzerimonas stutzeri TaxID=316 RepID=A4VIT2_STUS1|nr:HlyC/CorC family transporter [Stutzerimonas stutzeri]EPL59989.1 putative Mg2+ and Co2+ transporter CorB [Stutzerimonas stutzeri B1SMN1]MBA4689836.1 HlyC/CorC family transporter [Pseudomonas sp.]OHC17511.1 MAG: magnesium/cobalt efflux protein [Pseudomonadales bacterium RIFCSPHIGHO2_01_FULL_64_12]CJL10119.1 magnesium and cobalt efflux protein CorC [Streptococcus pneumoniae]ABP78883.1 putative Mg2+ and Co2+ transporter CorB [Stutzerimonas stutzeri A1501]